MVAAAVHAATAAYEAKGVRLLTQIPTRLADLMLDPDRMAQVLGNLLDNALRHTPPGGTVTISASSSSRTGLTEAPASGWPSSRP